MNIRPLFTFSSHRNWAHENSVKRSPFFSSVVSHRVLIESKIQKCLESNSTKLIPGRWIHQWLLNMSKTAPWLLKVERLYQIVLYLVFISLHDQCWGWSTGLNKPLYPWLLSHFIFKDLRKIKFSLVIIDYYIISLNCPPHQLSFLLFLASLHFSIYFLSHALL